MPIMRASVSASGFEAALNTYMTAIKSKWASHGMEMYRNTLADQLARIDVTSKAAIVQEPMIVVSDNYKVKGLTSPTDFGNAPPKVLSECGYERLDLWAREIGTYAPEGELQAFLDSLPAMAGFPALLPGTECLRLLGRNPVTMYDDKSLFNAAHLLDPHGRDIAANQGSNILTQQMTSDGWDDALQQIMTRKAPGSKTDQPQMPNEGLTGDQITIYVGSTKLASTLARIFDPTTTWAARVETGISAASETRKVFAQATIQYVPMMSGITGISVNSQCFVGLSNREERAIFARIPHMATVSKMVRDDHNQHIIRVSASQTFGSTPSYPWAMYRWDIGT